MRKMRIPATVICFVLIFGILYQGYVKVITPKYYTDQIYSTSVTYQGFYDLKKDTVDVLFFGSSHGSCGFLPQELYDEYGITSYNLSCEQQSLLTSYYWLKEACRYQNPKIVVLEPYMLFGNYDMGPLVSDSDLTRKAIESMKWSKNKIEAINDICSIDITQNKLSFYLPSIYYHDRWKSIEKKDFEFSKAHYSELKGYTMIPLRYEGHFDGYERVDFSDFAEMNPLMSEYFEKIKLYCKEQNIQLVLAYTPNKRYGKSVCATLEKYAFENDIGFIDFNMSEVMSEAKYIFSKMNSDKGHANIWGAKCITNYVGNVFATEYKLRPHQDEQWDETSEFYQFALNQCGLIYMSKSEQIDEYLNLISDERYKVEVLMLDETNPNCTRYEVREARTGRLIDIANITIDNEGKHIEHEYVDIN